MVNDKREVLIVDDDPLNLQFLEAALEKDYRLRVARDGSEAIGQVLQQAPDLILLDVIMPEINGFEVARTLRADEHYCTIPIIFLTNMPRFEGEIEGLESGGIDYITKPFNLTFLQLRVRNHLELKHKNDLIREQRDLVTRQKEEIEAAFARVRRLEGIISICMHCASIKGGDGSWQKIEKYLMEHGDAQFSHCVCQKCYSQNYADHI